MEKRAMAFKADKKLEALIIECAEERFEGNISMVIRAALKKYLEANC